MTSSITFHGGAEEVTGANFLFDTGNLKILIDCGLTQGMHERRMKNYEKFKYNPKEVDILFVTHAHADHLGLVPKLVKEGFEGVIYSTPATRDLAGIMFDDALKLLTMEAKKEGRTPIYDKNDVTKALAMWKSLDYYTDKKLDNDLTVHLLDAGHVLGSAMVRFERNGKKMLFTGDLGNTPAPILRDTDTIKDIDYMLMESVYGDRNHENREMRTELLAASIREAHKRDGTLLIPSFSLQRTQILLYEINNLVEDGIVPQMPVYLDSPLAAKITEVFKSYTHLYNDALQKEIADGDDIFDFPQFVTVHNPKHSASIAKGDGARIILAGSGMSVGGRVLMYEKELLENPNNILLFVGYQGAGTLGRQMYDGNKEVVINKQKVHVRATIDSVRGYSAHKDLDNLVNFVSDSADSLKQVFVCMGEPRSALFLTQRLNDYLGVNAVVPAEHQKIDIEF